MLQLNANAKRFCNEAAVPLIGEAVMRQPKGIMCLVTDKKFMKSVEIAGLEHGGPNYGRPVYYEDTEEDMKKVLGTGAKGWTSEGLHGCGTRYSQPSMARTRLKSWPDTWAIRVIS